MEAIMWIVLKRHPLMAYGELQYPTAATESRLLRRKTPIG